MRHAFCQILPKTRTDSCVLRYIDQGGYPDSGLWWLTKPTVLPSESLTKAIHSSIPAGPRLSSVWLKIDAAPRRSRRRPSAGIRSFRERRQPDRSSALVAPCSSSRRTSPALKEQQARRIEDAGRLCAEQALVEGSSTRQVIGMLRDLNDVHSASVARVSGGAGGGR